MKFLLLLLFLPLKIVAQDITGVWTGTLYNDTTRQYLKYELAISEYDGRLSGYSYTIFVINKVENIGVKSVKIRKSGDSYFIEDEKFVYNNYTDPPAKGVRMFSKLSLTETDTAMILRGAWKTNQTSHYRSITGNILLHKNKQIQKSLIIPKLEELGVAEKLSFMKDANKRLGDIVSNNEGAVSTAEPLEQKQLATDKVYPDPTPESHQSDSVQEKPKEVILNDSTIKVSSIGSENGAAPLKISSSVAEDNSVLDAIKQSQEQMAKIHWPAADVDSRTIETVKSVNIKSDSLRLTLYDNGEVDGDTVSVLLNGRVIWPMQRLTENGNSKTIYLTPEMGDSLELIMYAENLGSIPPNTGLLVVHDGDDAYEIRFSGDLQKNAAIILRRKMK